MAQFYVSNVNFESTGNNQLVYSANTVTIRVVGSNVATVNSSGVTLSSGVSLPNGATVAGETSNLSITVNNSFTVSGAVIYQGNVTPIEISANTADWAPGVSGTYNIRVSANNTVANSEYMITGMTAGTNGQMVAIHNIGAMGIWIRNEEAGSNGAILPGINTPGSTAANRFNLPNHFKLQGYQSATFYYDGTLSRWRLTDSTSIAFDHKKALTKGFFSGGYIAPLTRTTSDRTTYSTETTAAVPGANLSQGRANPGSVSNSCKGFFSGGATVLVPAQTYAATSDRTTYALETTAAVPGANLSQARRNAGGAGNACKGFFSGGCNPSSVATSDRTTYSTETTAAVPGANLSQARMGAGAAGNSCKGFFAGGFTTVGVSTTDRTTYSTETTAAVPGANLSQTRYVISAMGNHCKGFFVGGATSPTSPFSPVATADRATYSTETTAAVPGANLSQIRIGVGAAGNSCKGFLNGGCSSGSAVATADRTTYSTETTAAVPGANLSQARRCLAAI